jgi:hypothetical protein
LETARIETGAIQRDYDYWLDLLKRQNACFPSWLAKEVIRPPMVCKNAYDQLSAQRAAETYSVIAAFSSLIYSAGRSSQSMSPTESNALLEQLKEKQSNTRDAVQAFREFIKLRFDAIIGLIQQNKEQQLEALLVSETQLTEQVDATDVEERSDISDALHRCQRESESIRAELNSLKLSLSARSRLSDSLASDSDSVDGLCRNRYILLPAARFLEETLDSDLEDAAEASTSDNSDNGSVSMFGCQSESNMDSFSIDESNFPAYL